MTPRVSLSGAGGRMGRAILNLAAEEGLTPVYALEHSGYFHLGEDAGLLAGMGRLDLPLSADADAAVGACDVVIDFSSPANAISLLHLCAKAGRPVVIGTTGLSPEQRHSVDEAARSTAVLFSPNMATGVNALFYLVEEAARILKQGFDVEISEIHHHFKKDAPSGTAVKLKEIVRDAHGRKESDIIYGREGIVGERPEGEIAMHAMRGGDVVGEHTVFFFAEGERIEITHRATSRTIFARGALRAARFLAGKPAGLYTMKDVLGLR